MKKLLFVILTLVLFSTQCMAINKEWSAVLGFAGGFLTAQVVNGPKEHIEYKPYYHNHQPHYQVPPSCHPPVVISKPPICFPRPQPVYVTPYPQGHWEYIEEKTYIPGTWIYQQIGPNTYQKIWQEGYYQVVVKKVWVNH